MDISINYFGLHLFTGIFVLKKQHFPLNDTHNPFYSNLFELLNKRKYILISPNPSIIN